MLRSLLAGGAAAELPSCGHLTDAEWAAVYSTAVGGGVGAMLWDGVRGLDRDEQPARALRLQWGLSADNIRERYRRRRALIMELTDIWAAAGIKTTCLKGLALSRLYPDPEARESGDFDCWLGGDFARGNEVAVAHGAQFDPHDYRHSLITYKGLKVENHRYFLAIRGNGRYKRLERYLHDIADCDRRIGDSNLYQPSPQFHAMFLAMHALHHFLYEGIRLRHLCDWMCFVNAERGNVDWDEFNGHCAQVGAARFVAALNAVCIRHLGMCIDGTALRADEKYAGRVLADTLGDARRVSNIKDIWNQRMVRVSNMFSHRWKFNELYDRNFMRCIMSSVVGIIADPHPEMLE